MAKQDKKNNKVIMNMKLALDQKQALELIDSMYLNEPIAIETNYYNKRQY